MNKKSITEKFKYWLTRSSVNKVTRTFKYIVLAELLLLIITIMCLCSIIKLKKENKQLKKELNVQVEYIDDIHANVLDPLGL